MTTADITATMQGNAVWVVFANVLLQQLGLPVPAVPTLLAAGSLAMSFGQAGQLLAAAILASVFAATGRLNKIDNGSRRARSTNN